MCRVWYTLVTVERETEERMDETMMTMEMRETLWRLADEYVTYGQGCDEACEHCPYADWCAEHEGYWGCPCWEEGMGDDL